MRHHLNRSFILTIAAAIFLCGAAFSQAGTCSGMKVGQLTSLNGFVPFPSTSLWNTDISTAPVDSNSANYINFIGSTVTPQIGLVEAGLGIAIIPSFGVLAPETAR